MAIMLVILQGMQNWKTFEVLFVTSQVWMKPCFWGTIVFVDGGIVRVCISVGFSSILKLFYFELIWIYFKSLSICDFGTGNVPCSTELKTLEPFTPLEHNLQEPEERQSSQGWSLRHYWPLNIFCWCGAKLSLSNSKLFHVKHKECRKGCWCESVQNRANANVTSNSPMEQSREWC